MNKIKDKSQNQMHWVILLLAIAVILPTICLLWFMSQAVENVQFAAQQKLIDIYQEKLTNAAAEVNDLWKAQVELVKKNAGEDAMKNFMTFALDYGERKESAGVLITYDSNDKLLYPIIAEQTEPNLPAEFRKAWELEFIEKDFQKAGELYLQITDTAKDNYIWRKAMLGQARCEIGQDRGELAEAHYLEAATERLVANMSQASVSLAAYAKVMIADLEQRHNAGESQKHLGRLIDTAREYDPEFPSWRYSLPMDSATRMFVVEKTIEIAGQSPNAEMYENRHTNPGRAIYEAKSLSVGEEIAAKIIERYPDASGFADWPSASLHRLQTQSDMYGLCVKTDEKTFLLLRSGSDVRSDLSVFEKAFAGDDVSYQVLDDNGQAVGGIGSAESEAFLTSALSENMPGWKIKLYFADSDVFSKFAGRQAAIYVWAGVLVIVLILAAGGFAVQTVGRQMKLNRLKNDFIATVTHELKTPLASMRVLVDTLLEGNYKEQKQATEYLELIARENERLSNLIDNFLTFSRMERNKQAFEMLETSPALIANRATEAVKTKFEQGHCIFDVAVDKNLPAVQADQDAMVTALINLLDNAYKYSYDDKHIKLSVYAEVGSVCFRVADNGVGMSRRAIRKIFERFYQADQTLSRRAEGCGLGLSIVKFIVDAHNGSMNLESKPNKGSVFTIKLPAVENEQINGNGPDN